ncbi:hypothetical protein CHARACLAT_030041 [Characodon lateralis]|uniref:Uncharacterized protein n=1 Tax=Characodon lateralis TaxID=208331 RepID=A0ABU7F778_9TELE|nr:hypothetical protein [Characodon lateralis]
MSHGLTQQVSWFTNAEKDHSNISQRDNIRLFNTLRVLLSSTCIGSRGELVTELVFLMSLLSRRTAHPVGVQSIGGRSWNRMSQASRKSPSSILSKSWLLK